MDPIVKYTALIKNFKTNELAELLTENPNDLILIDDLFEWILILNYIELLQILFDQFDFKIKKSTIQALYFYTSNVTIEMMKTLIDNGLNLDDLYPEHLFPPSNVKIGQKLFDKCCRSNDLALIKFLVESNIDITLSNGFDYACMYKFDNLVQYLIDVGISSDNLDKNLYMAIQKRYNNLIVLLVNAGANVDNISKYLEEDHSGWHKTVDYLLDCGADPITLLKINLNY